MQEKATEFLQGVLAIAREEQLMSEGRLMSAAQVAEALSASTPWNPLLAGWFLCGDIHPELFARLKAGLQAQPLVAIKEGDTGVHYLLFAQRFGSWQHRFVMPLIGNSAREFLVDMQTSGVGVSLSTETIREAVVSRLPPSGEWQRSVALEVPSTVENKNLGALFDEVTLLMLGLLSPSVLDEGSAGVERACVTLIFTDELAGQVKALAGQ